MSDVGKDGRSQSEIEHEGVTEDFIALLHQWNREARRRDPSDTHVDGSHHTWEVTVNWECRVCGRYEKVRTDDNGGSSETIQSERKNGAELGEDGTD